MIQGIVSAGQILLGVVLRLSGQPDIQLEFVLDTGFRGEMTLPVAAVAALGLPYSHTIRAGLADGTRTMVDVHKARISWDDTEQEVDVLAMGTRPLIGSALLVGFHLEVDFVENGPVTLRRL